MKTDFDTAHGISLIPNFSEEPEEPVYKDCFCCYDSHRVENMELDAINESYVCKTCIIKDFAVNEELTQCEPSREKEIIEHYKQLKNKLLCT